jgi:hypothetical protein
MVRNRASGRLLRKAIVNPHPTQRRRKRRLSCRIRLGRARVLMFEHTLQTPLLGRSGAMKLLLLLGRRIGYFL